MDYLLAIALGYLLGSIPFAYLLGRVRSIDIRQVGTGNPGAANLFRKVSRPLGVSAAVLDGAKGAAAVVIGISLGLDSGAELLPGAAAVAGHWYPIFFRFRGGEGLATAIGAVLGALPIAGAIGLAVGVSVTAAWRNTGRGAGMGWAAFLGASTGLGRDWAVIAGVMGLGVVILARTLVRSREQDSPGNMEHR